MVEVKQTRVCAEGEAGGSSAPERSRDGAISAVERLQTLPPRSSRRGGQRTGRLVTIEESGHVWVQVSDGAQSYALRCMAMAPFEEADLHSEVLVWERGCGVGVVIGRGLESHPPSLRHTRESFVHTMEVQPHEVQEIDDVPDTSSAALARTAAQ